jgi:hypothetical protein
VEGLDRGRFAILSKTHHALVDGVSGLDILSVLFAPDREESGPWRPEPAPSAGGLVTEALLERVTYAGALTRPLRAVARHPRKAVSRMGFNMVRSVAVAFGPTVCRCSRSMLWSGNSARATSPEPVISVENRP